MSDNKMTWDDDLGFVSNDDTSTKDIHEEVIDESKVADNKVVTKEDLKEDKELADYLKSVNGDDVIDEPEEVDEPSGDEQEDYKDEIFASTLNDLKELGVIDFNPEEFEGTESAYLEVLKTSTEKKINEYFDGMKQNIIDEDGLAYIEFIKNGGNSKDFFNDYQKVYSNPEPLDLSKATIEQKRAEAMRLIQQFEGGSEEDIEDRVEFLEERGKLTNFLERSYEKERASIEESKRRILEEERLKTEQAKKEVLEFTSKITEAVKTGDFLTDSEKKTLPDYIVKTNIPQGGNFISKMHKDLGEALNDPIKLVKLAKFLNYGLDVKELKKDLLKGEVKKIKSALRKVRKAPKTTKK